MQTANRENEYVFLPTDHSMDCYPCPEPPCPDYHCHGHKHGGGICINNNPVVHVNVCCPNGEPEKPPLFLSSYLEVLGGAQVVAANADVAFDVDSLDSAGSAIELSRDGKEIIIHQTGLYHVEWNLNLHEDTEKAVIGLMENGQPASGSATVSGGSFASGTVISVTEVPFTLSLRNYNDACILADIAPYADTAASIRIVRFADAPG